MLTRYDPDLLLYRRKDWSGYNDRPFHVRDHHPGREKPWDEEVRFYGQAAPWFEQAPDEAILDLAKCGWGGDYPADAVAEFFEGKVPDITAMFKYKQHGFECYQEA